MKLLHPENRNCIPTAFVDFLFRSVGRIQCYGSVYVETLRERASSRLSALSSRSSSATRAASASRSASAARRAEFSGSASYASFGSPKENADGDAASSVFGLRAATARGARVPAGAPPPRDRARARARRVARYGSGRSWRRGRERNESRREPRELSDRVSRDESSESESRRAPRASTFVTPFPSRVFSVSGRAARLAVIRRLGVVGGLGCPSPSSRARARRTRRTRTRPRKSGRNATSPSRLLRFRHPSKRAARKKEFRATRLARLRSRLRCGRPTGDAVRAHRQRRDVRVVPRPVHGVNVRCRARRRGAERRARLDDESASPPRRR